MFLENNQAGKGLNSGASQEKTLFNWKIRTTEIISRHMRVRDKLTSVTLWEGIMCFNAHHWNTGKRHHFTEISEGTLALLTWINFDPAWISNYMNYKVWDGITYPFPNLISNFISHVTRYVITYPC